MRPTSPSDQMSLSSGIQSIAGPQPEVTAGTNGTQRITRSVKKGPAATQASAPPPKTPAPPRTRPIRNIAKPPAPKIRGPMISVTVEQDSEGIAVRDLDGFPDLDPFTTREIAGQPIPKGVTSKPMLKTGSVRETQEEENRQAEKVRPEKEGSDRHAGVQGTKRPSPNSEQDAAMSKRSPKRRIPREDNRSTNDSSDPTPVTPREDPEESPSRVTGDGGASSLERGHGVGDGLEDTLRDAGHENSPSRCQSIMTGGNDGHEEDPVSRSDPEDDDDGATTRYGRDVDTNRADEQYPEDDYDRENHYNREDRSNRFHSLTHSSSHTHQTHHHHSLRSSSHSQNQPHPPNRSDTKSPLPPPNLSPIQDQQQYSLHREKFETEIWSLKSATWNGQHESNARVESIYQDIARRDKESEARIRREDRESEALVELMFRERGLSFSRRFLG